MIKIINRGWLQEKGVWKSRELRESDKNRKEERNEAMKNLRSRFPSAREPTEQWRWCGKLPFLSGRYLCITIMRSRSKANWLQTGSVESKSPGKKFTASYKRRLARARGWNNLFWPNVAQEANRSRISESFSRLYIYIYTVTKVFERLYLQFLMYEIYVSKKLVWDNDKEYICRQNLKIIHQFMQ